MLSAIPVVALTFFPDTDPDIAPIDIGRATQRAAAGATAQVPGLSSWLDHDNTPYVVQAV